MRIEPQLTDQVVLSELGGRLARLRLARDLTQRQLGEAAGVGRTVVQRVETGAPVTTPNLIRVLRALDTLDLLERLISPVLSSPVEELRLRGRQRRRASGAHGRANQPVSRPQPWRWGDER